MEISSRQIAILYSPLFWALLCILCSSLLAEDVSSVPEAPGVDIPQNISANGDEKVVSDNVVVSSEVEPGNGEVPASAGKDALKKPYAEVAQNSGVANGASDGGQSIVVTLVDTASAELKQRADLSSQTEQEPGSTANNTAPTDVAAKEELIEPIPETVENKSDASPQMQQTDKLEVPKIEPKENLTEEIPSFSEWAQKQLEEAEKKREEVNASAQNHNWNGKNSSNQRLRSKNYASPDCGAKIVAANPEAVSPSSVLSPLRDEYKLNTCTSRIWFIVELCEAIQAKRIDLANFELFSSSPENFSVSVSDRFPSREWSIVGQFTAKDERDIQTFDLNPHLFGKYIKLEMHSHHGSEHFCPISLFRAYGTSEFEVLEKEDQPLSSTQDDDDDGEEAVDSEKGESTKNLFSSATDAVISIVKKAAEVLGNKRNVSNQTSEADSTNTIKFTPLISTCTTPSHIVVCDNCSDILFGKVYELLSCRSSFLGQLLTNPVINRTFYNTDICTPFGLDFHYKRTIETPQIYSRYLKSMFPPHYLAAICNTVAIIENKVVLNISKQLNITDQEADLIKEGINLEPIETVVITETMSQTKTEEFKNTETISASKIEVSTISDGIMSDVSYISQIKPTKTLTPDQMIELTHYISQEKAVVEPTQTIQSEITNHTEETTPEMGSAENENIIEFETHTESVENLDLEHFSDFNLENNTNMNSATPAPPKESVFLRLSNRIKTLERNMSLSSQYLEELSRRYKKQVEEMQRLLEKTVANLNEEAKKKDERNDQLEERIKHLMEIVEALVHEKNTAFNPMSWLLLVVLSMFGIFTFCRRSEHKFANGGSSAIEVQRRNSIDVINHNTPTRKERRPSEEALKITGTYEHLLVDDENRKRNKERRKKKKRNLLRSNSITTLTEDKVMLNHASCSEVVLLRSYDGGQPSRQVSMPGTFPIDWDEPPTINNGIEDIPFVLEESDNNPLQDLPLPKPLQEPKVRNGNVKPVRKISSPAYLKATEIRFNGLEVGHKKSASVDETTRQRSPVPSTTGSLNIDLEKVQKKEKKGTFKKIFKKVF